MIADPNDPSKTISARVPTYQPTSVTWDQIGRQILAAGKHVLAISDIPTQAGVPRDDAFFAYATARLAGITWYGAITDPSVYDLYRVRLGAPTTGGLSDPPNATPPACVLYRVFEAGLVAVNNDSVARTLSLGANVPTRRFYDLFAGAYIDATATGSLDVPAASGRVFLLDSTTTDWGLHVAL